jgi:hypothetical protein
MLSFKITEKKVYKLFSADSYDVTGMESLVTGGPDCGPSNALSNFAKQMNQDRSLNNVCILRAFATLKGYL